MCIRDSAYTIRTIIPPCPRDMKIIASVDNPSPNQAADKITDNGPKNTRPNVAIASASHARGLTIFVVEFHIHIKHTSQFLLKEYLSGKIHIKI